MAKEGLDLVSLISHKKADILEVWLQAQQDIPDLRLNQFNQKELRQQSSDILSLLVDVLRLDYWSLTNSGTPQYEAIQSTLDDLTESRTGRGFSAIETAAYIFSLKDSILKFLQDNYVDPEKLNESIVYVSRLIDRLGLMAFSIFNERSQRVIKRQQQEILELSTPVIHMWEGILVVPLIGTLDSVRAQQVMENLLHEIADTGYDVVILDIAGVSTVDTLVAQYLLKTVSAARLMGADCIISGIGPAIAQTIVQLGINLPAVKTTSTLAGALETAFKMLDLVVIRQRRALRDAQAQDGQQGLG